MITAIINTVANIALLHFSYNIIITRTFNVPPLDIYQSSLLYAFIYLNKEGIKFEFSMQKRSDELFEVKAVTQDKQI